MLELNWSDVVSTITQIRGYLIAIGVIAAVAVIPSVRHRNTYGGDICRGRRACTGDCRRRAF